MNNPILQMLGKQVTQGAMPELQNVKQMMNTIKNAKDPQATLQMMAQQNPQVKQVLEIINQNGGNAQKAFYEMASQYGIDPKTILKMMK